VFRVRGGYALQLIETAIDDNKMVKIDFHVNLRHSANMLPLSPSGVRGISFPAVTIGLLLYSFPIFKPLTRLIIFAVLFCNLSAFFKCFSILIVTVTQVLQ
jgi:hypothetical protein